MGRLGNVPEIKAVKEHLEALTQAGLIASWELPYENLLTRLSAAIFFFTLTSPDHLEEVQAELSRHQQLSCRTNVEKTLSELDWRADFGERA
jgi:hypothetical protein